MSRRFESCWMHMTEKQIKGIYRILAKEFETNVFEGTVFSYMLQWRDYTCGTESNSEIRRMIENKAVMINGKSDYKPTDKMPYFVHQLVLNPYSFKARCTFLLSDDFWKRYNELVDELLLDELQQEVLSGNDVY